MQLYHVTADPISGAWIDTPCHIGEVNESTWLAQDDTENCHYGVYEAEILDDDHQWTGETERRAILVEWIFD